MYKLELCAAAAADRNWSARRRRRPHVGVAPAPFSWRVHVILYTSYMLLDFCNANVYNEAWTLTKSCSKNDASVFCNSPWYSNETRQRHSKSVFVDNFVKMISDAKSFMWNFFANLVNKTDGTVKDFNSVYCSNCLKSSEIKAYRHCQHEEFVTTFWMFGINAGNFLYSVRPCQHWGNWKRGNGKRETVEKWHWKTRNCYRIQRLTKTWHILPVPLSLKLSIRHFATNVVMLYVNLK